MRTLLLSFVAVATASAFMLGPQPRDDAGCDNCKTNVTKMAKFLASPGVVNATVTSFLRDLCPYYAPNNDTKACEKNVTLLWPPMASALFNDPDVPMNACQEMKQCNKSKTMVKSFDDATCKNCVDFVDEVSKMFEANDTQAMALDFFNGTTFCAASKPPLANVSDCQAFAAWFTPAAMTVLGEVITLANQAVCQAVFNTCH